MGGTSGETADGIHMLEKTANLLTQSVGYRHSKKLFSLPYAHEVIWI